MSFSFLIGSQIVYLVNGLNRKNVKATTQEIEEVRFYCNIQLLNLYGSDALIFLLRCLVEQVDLRDPRNQQDQLKMQLLKDQVFFPVTSVESAG